MNAKDIFIESEKVELKQKLNEALAKEIVAFLNTNGGTVFIGVEDNGTICGVENLDDNLKKIADIIDDQIMPDTRQFIELGTKYIDNKHIIEIQVQKGNALFYIKKYGRSSQGCFVRSGSTCRAMSEEQIETTHTKFLNLKNKITEIATRQKNLTFQYLKILLIEKGFTINEQTFAENFHLLTSSGEYNKMAELLADKNEVSIKVVRFKGKSKAGGIISRNEYGEKCLVVAMKQAFDYCSDVINETRSHFDKGERVDTPLFDRDAFRETWFNACLHNNWIDGTPPAIYIYSNKMEIISTGGLPANLSQDDFFRGVSKPVNEELARLFIRLDLMEQTGYGVPMITQRYGKNIFEFLDFFLRVCIPFAFEIEVDEKGKTVPKGTTQDSQNNTINDTINDTIKLSDTEQRIFTLIKTDYFLTRDELVQKSRFSDSTVARALKNLQLKGLIIRKGSKKTGHWEIIKQAFRQPEYTMANKIYKLGELIEICDERNTDLKFGIDDVRGISTEKTFIETKANMDGVSLNSYKVVKNGEFVYVADTSRRGDKIALAFNRQSEILVSSIYTVFRIRQPEKLLSSYLFMYFNRPQFDRFARFNSWGSARETFDWADMCDIEITLPSLDIQQKFVQIYETMVENWQSFNQGLDDLKLVCDGYIENLRKNLPCEKIGKYLQEVIVKNDDLKFSIDSIKGISNEKEFIKTKADTNDLNTANYKIVKQNQFAFNPNTARMGDKFSIAFNYTNDNILVSSIYPVFEVIDATKLNSVYLMMFFKREEFDKYVRFNSWGSARETFTWSDLCEVSIPIPNIEIQKSIAEIYNAYTERKQIAERLNEQIKQICPVLIKGSLGEQNV